VEVARPQLPAPPSVNRMELLRREQELVGMYLSSHPLDTYKFEIEQFADATVKQLQEVCEQALTSPELRNKEYVVGALITSFEQKQTKTGRDWCKIVIEDEGGNIAFSLFGKDYQEFIKRGYDAVAKDGRCGKPILVKVRFSARYPNLTDEEKEELKRKGKNYRDLPPVSVEPKIVDVMFLSNARESFIKGMNVKVPVNALDPVFRKELISQLKHSKGEALFTLTVCDTASKVGVEFFSRKYKVAVTDEFISFFDRSGIQYSFTKEVRFG